MPRGGSVTFVPQMERTECGAACLTMVLRRHGRHASLVEVRQACSVSRDGSSARQIVRAARDFGLEAQGRRVEAAGLRRLPLPAVLHWNGNHFVVLERVGARRVTVVDPARGRRQLDWREVGEAFAGVALTFQRGPAFRPSPRPPSSLRRYARLLLGGLPPLGLVGGAALGAQLLELALPAATQLVVDHVIRPRQADWLAPLVAALAAAALLKAVIGVVRDRVVEALRVGLDLALIGRFVDHLVHLPVGFFQQRTPGDLLSRLQGNLAVRELLTLAVTVLLDLLLLAGYALMMFAYDASLAAVVVGMSLLRVGFVAVVHRRTGDATAAELAGRGRESAAAVEAFSAPEAVRAFAAEGRLFERYVDRRTERANAGLARQRLTFGVGQLVMVLDGASRALLLWIGGARAIDQEISYGVLASFVTLQWMLARPLESLLGTVFRLSYIKGQLVRLDDVLETARERQGGQRPQVGAPRLALEGVCFQYAPSGPRLLDGVDLQVAPGEEVALVGPTGAGKSTVAALVLGFAQPNQGRVLLDGQPLEELDLELHRRRLGVVLQRPELFADTVLGNITLGDPRVSVEDVRWAARHACFDEVVARLPRGYDTRIGEGGQALSGGERQRLALARALARRPGLLVLDEATSALDPATEARVQAGLAAVGCTRLVIAHRLAAVRNAARIVVLDQGRVVQQGSYAELVRAPGLFHTMVAALDSALPAPGEQSPC